MTLLIFTDGGARGNPGPGAAAFVVKDDSGNLQYKRGKYLGVVTNNEAEYGGVVEALGWAQGNLKGLIGNGGNLEIRFFLDSKLVVNQLNGLFKVKEPRLRVLLLEIRAMEQNISGARIEYKHLPREENSDADLLVNQTLDLEAGR